MFTYLEDFKKNGILSQPYFVITLFDELINSKGLCLIRGDIIDGKLTKEEANLILKYKFMFFLTPELYSNYPNKFNHDSNNFDLNKYCSLLEIENQ